MKRLTAVLALLAAPLIGDQGVWQKVAYTAQKATVQTVKAGPGTLGGFSISNAGNAATSSCVQVFDTAGTVTLGTTTPSLVYEVAGGVTTNFEISQGVSMLAGIQLAAATTCTGNTAPTTGLNITVYYR